MPLQRTKSILSGNRQHRLFGILLVSTIFDCLLLECRLKIIDYDWTQIHNIHDLASTRGTTATFLFLVWNLFLAWIPYWTSLALGYWGKSSAILSGGLLLFWLLFFPNAPYLLTDLMHLYKQRGDVPFWLDVMLILSFAWTGLMLGYASMFEVQYFLERRFPNWLTKTIMVGSIWLAGFGVYMGRFQRLNSWDVFTRPWAVVRWELHVLGNPMNYISTLGVAFAISGFMMVGYFTILALKHAPQR
jgi:uncharacterized membrane protein